MKSRWLWCILPLMCGFTGYSEIVNSSIDTAVLYDAGSMNVSSDLDQGWHAWTASVYDLSEHDIWSTGLMSQSCYWFGQIFTDQHTTFGSGSIEFDVTYMGSNIKLPVFEYAVFGTDETNAVTTALSLNVCPDPAGPAWTLISRGSVSVPTAGNYHASINFGDSTYNYLGVRFRFSGTTSGRGTDYATAVDNIFLTADDNVIPEPAAISLVGLGCIVVFISSRFVRQCRSAV